MDWLLCMGTVTSPAWIISPGHAVELSPAQYKIVCILFWADLGLVSFWVGSGPFQKKIKKYFKKTFLIPRVNFLRHFDEYRSVFLYRKDTNPVLKYPVFIKKKCFCFHAYNQVSQSLKKIHIVFSYKENFKKYVLAYILALITRLLKS